MKLLRTGLLAVTAFAALGADGAQAEEAIDIARAALDNNLFANSNASASVDLEIYRDGKVVRERAIQTLMKRDAGLVRSFVEFTKPADVAGTKFLSLEEKTGETQQFIYLPAFKKVKRIVGAQKSKSFMGTDFSYSDLEGCDVDDYAWKRLPDEKVMGEDCYVIEGVPKGADDAYGKSVSWVHKTNKIPLKVEFFDKKGAEIEKRLTVNKLQKKDNRWIATESIMATLNKKTHTRLKLTSIDFNTAIPDSALTREALER